MRNTGIHYPKFVLQAPGKVDHSSLKSLEIYYAPMPLIVPNFIALGQTMYTRKALQIFTLQYFGAPMGLLAATQHQLRYDWMAK